MSIHSLLKTLPLRLVLIVPFIIQLLIITGLIGWLSFRSGQQTVDDLLNYLQQEVTARIHQHLDSYLSQAKQINHLNSHLLDSGLFKLTDFDKLGKLFWNEVAAFDFAYINLGTTEREYIGAGHVGDRAEISELKIPDLDQLKMYAPDQFGNRDHFIYEDLINPNNEAWYTDTMAAQKPRWSPIYSWEGFPDQVSIANSTLLYDTTKKIRGIMGIDIKISQLNAFLKTLSIGKTGTVFIMERDGLLVASSSTTPPYQMVNNEAKRYSVENCEDELIRSTAQALKQRVDDLKTVTTPYRWNFTHAQHQYWAQITPYQDEVGLDWLTVVMVPERDFMVPIQANIHNIWLLSIGALIIAIGLGILTARWIVEPISRINQAAKNFAEGRWEQPPLPISPTYELGQLTHSFNHLASHLKASIDILETINRDLQNLHRLKDDFLLNTSHQLRTPLHGIMGLAQSLIEGVAGELSPAVKSNLTMMVASGKQLSTLVNDLLDFSKLKHQKLELELKSVGIRELVDIVFTITQPLLHNKPLRLVNQLEPQLPLVTADENRLQQILYNLIENAIKFTAQGQIVVSAQVNQSQLEISVTDTGIGMSSAQLDDLFESFEQLNEFTTRPDGCIGLGLTITKQLVELQGGALWVTSQLGVGSTFTFSLPLDQPLDDLLLESLQKVVVTKPLIELPPPELVLEIESVIATAPAPTLMETDQPTAVVESTTVSQSPEVIAVAPGGFKILTVDDDLVNLQLLNNYLFLQNYTIVQATSGPEALALIKSGLKPDVMLLDVMMPQMTGYEVTRQLREQWSPDELPIILLTAKTQVSDVVAGLAIGANDYLTKPVEKDELLARLQTHLHIKKLQVAALRQSKDNENRLRQFLEAMPVGVAIHCADGRLIDMNKKAVQLLGKEVIPGIPVEQLTEVYQIYLANPAQTQICPPEQQPMQRALKGETVYVDDLEIHHPDRIIPIEVWSTPVADQSGNIQYAIAAFQDITERKLAQQAHEQFTQQLFQMTHAYERFVPEQFLSLLGRNSIMEIQLGDQVEKYMTVLFSDIRGFTTLSERMTPQENFGFINSYLSRMEPIIGQHYGFVDKYIGDAIMALFPHSDDALRAAIAMLQALKEYNEERQHAGHLPVAIGIGLNTGPLMLGTVGSRKRMEGTVISDAVNLASRVEGLTKVYQTSLLITQQTYLTLHDPFQYHLRLIDVVKVKGKSKQVTVYEVYDVDEPESIAGKDYHRAQFEEGFQQYHAGHFAEALPIFEQLSQLQYTDTVAQIYLNRCQDILGLLMPATTTILLVDDMPSNLRLLLDLLISSQFKVLVAKNGETALSIANLQQPHLILLDVMMPDIDGFETCQRLKAHPQTRHIPVIFMTALNNTEDKVRGFEVGAVDYITKPYQTEEVLARIRVHLNNHYLRQRLVEVL